MVSKTYKNIIKETKKAALLDSAAELLEWDMEVMMPKKAQEIRSQEMSVLAELSHKTFTQKKLGKWLNNIDTSKLNKVQSANIRELKDSYKRSTKVPSELIKKISETTTKAHHIWEKARQDSDFEQFKPILKKIIELNREYAKAIDPNKNPYEVLMHEYEPGLTTKQLDANFTKIKSSIVPLIEKISQKKIEVTTLNEPSEETTKEVCKKVAKMIGYDFEKGRLDTAVHPFTAAYGRITTRYNEGALMAVLGVMHEAGHGMYEHGLPLEHYGTPAGMPRSLGVHESQSRLWENHIGRSKDFLKIIAKEIPNTSAKELHSIANHVKPGFIRVNADELTYDLHIILRYELENGLINGTISVDELPEEWNKRMKSYLGIRPNNDKEGVLQDVHWSAGLIGYFPTYTLGNIYAAQLFETAKKELPNLNEQLKKGTYSGLKDWLGDKIHRHGQVYTTDDLIKNATGKETSADDYINYLNTKFKNIYGV